MRTDELRPVVEAVGRELGSVAREAAARGPVSTDRLVARWSELERLLDLGPAPELRACPHCGALGMRAAKRCGVCWQKLVPPASGERR